MPTVQRIQVIDSHTGGEPTRVVIAGGPDLGGGGMAQCRARLRERFDWLRTAVVNEPRGSDVLVGALLCPPSDPTCATGVVYFNNVGYINMCGHGTIGLVVTLAYLGRIGAGRHRIETPVGIVTAEYDGGRHVTIENVPSYLHRSDVTIEVDGIGPVTGDIAWGGNWFFLVDEHDEGLVHSNVARLTDVAWRIRRELQRQGITGADGQEIDHIELSGLPHAPTADSRNFVLCPGGAYDRSPCGTGTSAKLACLIAKGQLLPGHIWRQESIIGSIFEGSATLEAGKVLPRIRGSAHVTAEATLLLYDNDPYRTGIPT